MYDCLKDYLSNARPFLEGEDFEKFKSELMKIPNVEERFKSLLKETPIWVKRAKKYGVFFLLENGNPKEMYEGLPLSGNFIYLKLFDCGKCPTIEIVSYP